MMRLSFEDMLIRDGVLLYTIKGISMLPLIRQKKDLVVITAKSTQRLHKWDIAFFKRDNEDYVIHRVLKVKDNGYGICGDNQAYIEDVREDQILGYVTRVTRGGKSFPVAITKDAAKLPLWYRLYVHLWCDFFWIRSILVRIEYRLRKIMK